MENNLDKITVTTESGRKMEANVIDVIEIPDFNKQYVFYTFDEKTDDGQMKMYVSILVEEDNGITLQGIQDDDEWDVVKEVLDSMYKDESA